ncbi:MAG: GNAT family N-acetyltransferase, partial [Actinobacteria bacterium]|nr:GNAT family N-acetyltransferase [Actinomycetota bacterium]
APTGPVYTPPIERRRGYAGALTATLSNELRNGGAKLMLYTDAGNPTSNGVYQKIGYVKLAENERVSFVQQL